MSIAKTCQDATSPDSRIRSSALEPHPSRSCLRNIAPWRLGDKCHPKNVRCEWLCKYIFVNPYSFSYSFFQLQLVPVQLIVNPQSPSPPLHLHASPTVSPLQVALSVWFLWLCSEFAYAHHLCRRGYILPSEFPYATLLLPLPQHSQPA
jgi:hypothetical protein